MKRIPLSLRFLAALSFAGLAFSGYLVGVKVFSSACAFGESCPLVFGIPACFYGFALYVLLALVAVLAIRSRIAYERALLVASALSFIGVVFAGTLTLKELPTYLQRGFEAYALGVPTCFLGLVFFMLILVVAAIALAHHRDRTR